MKKIILSSLLGVAMLVHVGCKKQPQTSISANKTNVETGEIVSFTNSTVDGESYLWDLGDGTTSTLEAPAKSYDKAGTYAVSLTAFSKKEKKSSASPVVLINVNNKNAKYDGVYTASTSCGAPGDKYNLEVQSVGTNGIHVSGIINETGILGSDGTSFTTADEVYVCENCTSSGSDNYDRVRTTTTTGIFTSTGVTITVTETTASTAPGYTDITTICTYTATKQ